MTDDDDNNMSHLIRVENTPIVYRTKPRKVLCQRYMLGQVLGEGSYARVKECIDLEARTRCAIKIVALRHVRKKIPGGLANVDREVSTLQTLNHRNVVKLLHDFTIPEREKRYLVLEYCAGSVHDVQAKGLPLDCQKFRCLSERQAHLYFMQLIDGVEYLHSMRVVHKDLKPGNLLVTADEVLKITDFGTCERLAADGVDDLIHTCQATPAIQPPEVARGELDFFSGFKLDVYCMGVSLFFMLAGRVPYRDANVLRIYERICAGEYEMPQDISREAQQLIRQLLAMDPEDRPSVGDIRKFSWCCDRSVFLDRPRVKLEDVFNLISADQAVQEAEQALLSGGNVTEESTELGLDYTREDMPTSTPLRPRVPPAVFDISLENGSVLQQHQDSPEHLPAPPSRSSFSSKRRKSASGAKQKCYIL